MKIAVDLSEYVEIRDGRAEVRGRRLPVAFVAEVARQSDHSIADLAYQFTLTREQVLSILLYYAAHQGEIDARDATDAAESQQLNRKYGGQPNQSFVG